MNKKEKVFLIILILTIISAIFCTTNVNAASYTVRDAYGSHTLSPGGNVSLGASVLTMNQNVFCIAREQDTWIDQANFSISPEYTVSNNKEAYILAQDKFPGGTYGGWSESGQHGSLAQNAYWIYKGQGYYTYPTNILNRADEFANYRRNYSSISKGYTTPTISTLSNGDTIIGPYKIIYSKSDHFGAVELTSVTGEKNNRSATLTKNTDYYLSSKSDGSNTIAVPDSNTNFYLVVKANKGITKISNINFKETEDRLTVSYINVSRNSSNGQNIKVVKPSWTHPEHTLTITINETLTPDVKIKLYKRDFAGNKIEGAKLSITAGTNAKSVSATTLTSNSDGYFGELTITPTTNNGEVKIKIKETSTPDDVIKYDTENTVTVKYNKTTGDVTSITQSDSSGHYVINDNKIILKNEIDAHLLLDKGLVGAKFSMSFTNMEQIKIHKKYIDGSTPNLTKGTYSTDGDYFVIKGDSSGSIVIKNLITKEISYEAKSSTTKYKGIYISSLKFKGDKSTTSVGIRETEAPVRYQKIEGRIVVKLKLTKDGLVKDNAYTEDGEVTKEEFDPDSNVINYNVTGKTGGGKYLSSATSSYRIKIKIRDQKNPGLLVGVYKYDDKKNELTGAKFKVTYEQNSTKETDTIDLSSSYSGNAKAFVPDNLTDPVKVTIEETTVPKGYSGCKEKIVLNFVWDASNRKWTATSSMSGTRNLIKFGGSASTSTSYVYDYYNSDLIRGKTYTSKDETDFAIKVKNVKMMDELLIKKLDAYDNSRTMSGAEFKITLGNVRSYKYNGVETTAKTIDNVPLANGAIKLTDLEMEDSSKDIVVTLKETKAPDAGDGYYYKPINGEIKITFAKNSDGEFYIKDIVKPETNSIYDVVDESKTKVANDKATIAINNVPLIKIGGQVWIDLQKGEKGVKTPDGLNNDGKYVQGVNVYLINNHNGNQVNSTPHVTDGNGTYQTFEDLEQTKEGYRVIFEYNGIWYEGIGIKGDSDAKEDGRTEFNNKFATITKGEAHSKLGEEVTKLTYDYDSAKKTSKLKADNSGKNPATNKQDFSTIASAPKVTKTDLHVDCGVEERFFDLAAATDVESATVSINGKTAEYTYTDLKDKDINMQISSVQRAGAEYSLYLYKSDYNYRIQDYKTDSNSEFVNLDQTDAQEIVDNIANADNPGNEIEVLVNYRVIIKNQSTETGKVNSFVYYYDEKYEPVNLPQGFSDNRNEHKLVYNGSLELNRANSYRQEIPLTFKANVKDLIPDGGSLKYTNLIEITSYSSDGFIDDDSAPDNGISGGRITQYEDDTDEANGIKISVPNSLVRKITGTVFDDLNKNGIKDSGEPVVNDVIVQLIEIKKINGKYKEYIWQETRSGHNDVRTIDRGGFHINAYTNSVTAGSGQYEFRNYIPGNYIIRYIYGDGSVYDFTDNVKKYSGEDYKSTVDENYNAVWYNTSNYFDDATKNKARDNEARRLEVMAFSTEVDEKLGAVLDAFEENRGFTDLSEQQKSAILGYYNDVIVEEYKLLNDTETDRIPKTRIEGIFGSVVKKDTLDDTLYKNILRYASFKTWMCAETSKINVPVDGEIKDKVGETEGANTATVTDRPISFSNMHFGLELRPQTTLMLEKHLTALKITPTGVGVQPIADATANIKNILADPNRDAELAGVRTGLTSMGSVRKDSAENNVRGWWKLETDIEELAQGANLEATYTYAVTNNSDEDYLSQTLMDSYTANIDNVTNYSKFLKEKAIELKPNLKGQGKASDKGGLLGEYYFTGTKGANDVEVTARVEEIQEAINNDLTFVKEKSVLTDKDLNKTTDIAFEENTGANKARHYLDTNGASKDITINTVVKNTTPSESLKIGETDYTKTLAVEKVLSASGNEGIGTDLPSYMVEITKYTTPTGARDISSNPGNLAFVHSEDNSKIEAEEDEFWGERIIISKPTGGNNLEPLQITVIVILSAAILVIGIVPIKKIILKK